MTRLFLILAMGLVLTGFILVSSTGVAGFLTMPQTMTVNAAPEPPPPLDCLSCHPRELELHDKLGSGNKACWVCHDSTDMKMLRLVDETQLPLADSPRLCGQCHQKRYAAWKEGTHGIPAWTAIPGADKAKCTACHDPHQPQIALLNITEPHPSPAPSPPSPPIVPLVMLVVSLLLVIAVGVVLVKKGKQT